MAKFFKLKVAEVKQETADCVSIAFDLSGEQQQAFQYIQGQYVTVKLQVNGEELRRSYSICSSPLTGEALRIAAKKVEGGRGSTFLAEKVKAGDELEVMTPMGGFYTTLSASNAKNYVLFAGGSGITPMLSIIKSVLKAEPNSSLLLLYGNQNEASTIFYSQINELAAANAARFSVHYILDQPTQAVSDLYKGMMTKDKVPALIQAHVDLSKDNEFFICGPTPMMQNVESVLIETLKQPKAKVHLEYFTAALDAGKQAAEVPTGARVVSQVTIILDGDEQTVELASDGPAILDAALDADMDVPFACKGAVCCTCRAKLVEGEVHMKMNYALSESEVAAGYILTCQSHPKTPVVVVDYDQQ